MASESHCHRRQSLTSSDSSRTVDLSVIHDTLTILRTETLWREPDTLGLIYPLITASSETSVSRHTDKNIVTIRADTLSVTGGTDNTETTEVRQDTSLRSPAAREGVRWQCWLPWVLLAAVLVVLVVLGLGLRYKV